MGVPLWLYRNKTGQSLLNNGSVPPPRDRQECQRQHGVEAQEAATSSAAPASAGGRRNDDGRRRERRERGVAVGPLVDPSAVGDRLVGEGVRGIPDVDGRRRRRRRVVESRAV